MNRKQRRSQGKNGNGGESRGPELERRDDGKMVLSIPVPEVMQHRIADRDKYRADFATARDLVGQDKLAEATKILADLLKQNPTDYGVLELLGVASEKLKNYNAAIQFFEGAKKLQPSKPALDVAIANLLIKIDKIDEGMALAEKCIAEKLDKLEEKDKAAAYGVAGNAYMLRGEEDRATPYLRLAATLDPYNLEHLYNYVSQAGKPKTENDPFFLKLLELAEKDDSSRTEQENSLLYYALFDCYDSLKRHEKAFDYALKGAAHKRKILSHNSEKIDILFKGIKNYFDADFFKNVKEKGYEDTDIPVFVLGMPRSGTTLLEQILQSHPDIRGVGEDALMGHMIKHYSLLPARGENPYPLRFTTEIQGYFTPEIIGRKYAEYLLKKHPDAKRVVNKAIGNILWFGYIHIALPNARFIHIKRDAMDSCISTFTKNFIDTAQGYSYDLKELGTYYRSYVELMEHWNTLLPGRIFNTSYEEIVDDLEGSARRIIDHLGLPWNDRCLDFHKTESVVRTASIAQVRNPIYKSSVGRWKRYGPAILPLIEALGHAAPEEARAYAAEHESKI